MRLCPDCSIKLNYHSKKRLIKKEKRGDDEKYLSKMKKKHTKKEKKYKKIKKEKFDQSSSDSDDSDEKKEVENANVKIENDETNEKVFLLIRFMINITWFFKDNSTADSSVIWTKKAVVETEKTIEDEFDEFIDDLLF